jgi:hypothetical protein
MPFILENKSSGGELLSHYVSASIVMKQGGHTFLNLDVFSASLSCLK